MKLNILQLCLSPDLGGLELYMQKLSSFLFNSSHLTCIINKQGKLKEIFDEKSLEYVAFKKSTKIFSILDAKKIAKIIDKKEIDIIHIHWTKDLLIAVLAKLFSKRKPKLIQTRHMHMTRFKNDFYHKFLYKNVDLIIAVTKLVQKQLERFIPNDIVPKVRTSYIGAKSAKKITKEEKEKLINKYHLVNIFTIAIIGRIEKAKGQYLVVDAIKKLKKKDIQIQALIVGHAMENDYLNKLKQDIKENGLEKNIIFTGFTNKVQNIMQLCDVIVLATKKETFGLVLIEAMQSEICVVGTKNAGPLEIIEDKKSGLLFNSLDSKDLANKLEYLYKNKKEKESLAKNGKERVKQLFEEKKQFYEVLKILEEL